MPCSRCNEESLRNEFRSFWKLVPPADKRQFATGSGGLGGAVAGWSAGGPLGGLVGLFLGGCLGLIGGLVRYREASS